MLTTARRLYLYWDDSVQYMSFTGYFFKISVHIILSFTSRSSMLSLFLGFPNKIPYAFLFSPVAATHLRLSTNTPASPWFLTRSLSGQQWASGYAVSPTSVPLPPSWAQISPSPPYSPTTSAGFNTIYSVHFDGMAAPLIHTFTVLYSCYMFRHHTIIRRLHIMTTAYKYNTV